jgi:hypothetical protein
VALQLSSRRFALLGVAVAVVVVVVVSGRARVFDCGKYVREEEENRKGIAGKCVWQFVSIKNHGDRIGNQQLNFCWPAGAQTTVRALSEGW